LVPLDAADIVDMTNRFMASGFNLKQVVKGIATELKRCLRVDWMTLVLPEGKDRPFRFIPSESPPGWQEPVAGETVEKLAEFCESKGDGAPHPSFRSTDNGSVSKS